MTYRRTITAFVAMALVAAATTAAALRPHAPNAAQPELASLATMGPKPMPEIKKPVRYEAIISNWKRYRSTRQNPTDDVQILDVKDGSNANHAVADSATFGLMPSMARV